jgi:O-acetyl-ADP-ribose deacetylase (regulator of RNase III)
MIQYLKGDATRPIGEGSKCIMHIANTAGGWGRGFVVSLSKRWTGPEEQYRKWYRDQTHPRFGVFALGNVGWVIVEPELWVANMIAQVGYGRSGNQQHKTGKEASLPPIRYNALRTCLTKVAEVAKSTESTIHAPRIGCNLSGGSWDSVEPLIQETMHDLQVFIYDFPGGTFNP